LSASAELGTFDPMRAAVQADYLAALPASIERLRLTPRELAAHQNEGLRALLAHAAACSPFHRRRLAGIDVDRFELADLASLPVMTKTEMMDDLGAVFTDARLTPAIVERALAATTTAPVPIFGEYLALTSGGSSGRRGVFVLDRRAAVEFIASLSRSLMARLAASGGPPPGGLRVAMVGAPSAVHATGSASAWTAGSCMPLHFLAAPATLPLPEIVDRLNTLDAPMLAGYPTMLVRLADERRAGRLRIAPRLLSSTSESLHPHLRAAISEGFGAPVVDIFGSTEGLVGTSAPDDDVLVFNSDVCITELVDENDQPVRPGTPSAKVLVTNLSNHVQPLIRYVITDRFVGQPLAPTQGLLRATVEGRADEVLRYDDVDIHPIVVRSVLVRCPEVLDYQVHQTHRGIAVSALSTGVLDVDGLRERLAHALRGAGLIDAEVTVQAADALQRHHETGKLRRFVPLVMSRE
jgi:phenylacetate-coenzyme A ligase PaaK-like adenylate-forming protein